jgi:hypothetical protein
MGGENQTITRFDRWSMSEMAILQQLSTTKKNLNCAQDH